MKKIICLYAILSLALINLFACIKSEKKFETVATTQVEEKKETHSIKNQTTERALNPDIVLKISEQDTKTSYNVVKFGKYNMDIGRASNVEWLVVDGNDTSYLLVSRYILDCKNYNDKDIEVSWQNANLNSWLNNYFINSVFSSDEIAYMNPVNEFNFSGKEKVTLLNIAACEKYFGREDVNKRNYRLSAEATTWAISNWEEVVDNKNSEFYHCGSFYLTDNGTTDRKAAWVGQYGHIYIDGQSVKLDHGDGVRPVIAVKRELFGQDKVVSIDKIVSEGEENIEVNETIESDESIVDDSINELDVDVDETTIEIVNREARKISSAYSNASREKYTSPNVPVTKANAVDLTSWGYGRTPIIWEYVAPNTQLISNNSPNKSPKFAFKMGASSGSKGCYMTVFSKCESLGSDWDGRLYTTEDYTKSSPENLDFEGKFESLMYGEYNVKELLAKKYELEDVTQGLVKANGEYVNIVYISELDEIIETYK